MIHVIIPVFNRLQDTIKCLESLRAQRFREMKIYVVDDGSTDGTAWYLREHFAEVAVLPGTGDLWWTGAMKKGVEHVMAQGAKAGDFVLSLNNDVTLAEDTLDRLYAFSLKNSRAIVAALSLNSIDRSTVVTSGSRVRSWMLSISRHPFHGRRYEEIDKGPLHVDFLNGRCTLWPLPLFAEIGNFDSESFPHYAGDYELSNRAKRAGWQLFLLLQAVAFVDQERTGLNPAIRQLTVPEMFRSLWSIRSSSDLRMRTRFAFRCCPWYAVPTYLTVTYLKIIATTFLGNLMHQLARRS